MKNKGTISLVIAGLIALTAALTILIPKLQVSKDNISLGSVTQGNEYLATTTKETDGTTIGNTTVSSVNIGGTLLVSGGGTLGSVVITGAGAGVINLFDGTTTLAHTDSATTTLATIPASAAAGTYTFDAGFKRGLIMVVTGTAPTSTVTFRK